MPTFSSTEAIKQYIISRSKDAVAIAQQHVYQVIDRFLKEYYAEFDPSMYDRTYQLLCSLVKTGVISTGSGWEAEVYFDAGALNYVTGTWSGGQVLSSAAHGSHGGKVAGTAIYDEPVAILSTEAIEILKNALIAAGIPIS